MSIASSVYAVDEFAQPDGRRYVIETHTDNVGIIYKVQYLADPGTDYAAVLAARALALADDIADAEFARALNADERPTLRYQTAAQFVARFRAAYLSSDKEVCARMSWWLLNRITAGDVTDAQVQNAFSLTTTQYNALKANYLIPFHDAWEAVLTARGQ